MALGVRRDELAGCEHDVRLDQVVDRQPVRPTQVADPAAECQAGDPGRPGDTRRQGEPERMGRMVDVGQHAARLDPDGARVGINPDPLEPAEVDDQTVVDRAEAGPVVAASADGDQQVGARRPARDAALTSPVSTGRATSAGSSVDPAVVDASGVVVVRVVRAR